MPRLSNLPVAKRLGVLLGLAALYVVAGKLGLRLAVIHPSATPVWPPTGIAIAALLLLGSEAWPAIFVGAYLVNITTAGSPLTVLGIATGNTLEAVVGAALAARWAGGAAAFERIRWTFAFAVLAAGLATTISATLGTLSLLVTGFAGWINAGAIWVTWWLGDATGALLVTPLILLWREPWPPSFRWRRWPEALTLALLLVATGVLVFGPRSPVAREHVPLEFAALPLLLWAAFRFGRRETVVSVAVLAALAIRGTVQGAGPFATPSPNVSLMLLQMFLSAGAITSLVLATAVAERGDIESQLRVLSTSDPLTGLANYRHLMTVLEREIRRVNRTQRPLAVLFLDLDGLKRINDQFGHLVGSRALLRVAAALRSSCREIDTPSRYGGDEFAVVFPESDEEAAWRAGRRLADRLASDAESPPLTASYGIAVYPRDGTTAEALLATADRVLYAMKHVVTPQPRSPEPKRPS